MQHEVIRADTVKNVRAITLGHVRCDFSHSIARERPQACSASANFNGVRFFFRSGYMSTGEGIALAILAVIFLVVIWLLLHSPPHPRRRCCARL
jgi:hypothetical protein